MGAQLRVVTPVVALMLALIPHAARSQAMRVEYDLNVPAYAGARDVDHNEFATSRGVAVSAGWISKRYIDGVRGHRWTVHIGGQQHKSELRGTNSSVLSKSTLTIEVGHDWYVTSMGPVVWSMGAAFGPVFVSSTNETYGDYCDTPFCNLPDGGFQVSCSGHFEIPVTSEVAVLVGIRSRLLGPGRAEIFPFAPGPVFSAGFELGGWK